MKSLNTIQTFSKIAKIISRIVFVFSIIGLCFSVIGLLAVSVSGSREEILEQTETNLKGLLSEESLEEGDLTIADFYCALSISILFCGTTIIVSAYAVRYFNNELKAGTPFTFEGAKELLSLGILSVATSLGTSIVGGIIVAICEKVKGGKIIFDNDMSGSITIGVAFIVLSVVFKYGAELEAERANYNNPYYGGNYYPDNGNNGQQFGGQ